MQTQCNEDRPVCANCHRHGVPCVYTQPPSGEPPLKLTSGQAQDQDEECTEHSDTSIIREPSQEYPESRSRRLLELRLLHHYACKTSLTIEPGSDLSVRVVWHDIIADQAFSNDALLYSMLSVSAQHLSKTFPQDLELKAAQGNYLNMVLPIHRRDITLLSMLNADAICLTSTLLRISEFARFQHRPLEPYVPPVQWLLMHRSALKVFREASQFVASNPNSIARQLFLRSLIIWDRRSDSYTEMDRAELSHLLYRSDTDDANEPWSSTIQSGYESIVYFLGSVAIAIAHSTAATRTSHPDATPVDTLATLLRRLLFFPIMASQVFIDLLGESKPRALAVVAHYFDLLRHFRDTWWVGDMGEREIQAILGALAGTRWESGVERLLMRHRGDISVPGSQA